MAPDYEIRFETDVTTGLLRLTPVRSRPWSMPTPSPSQCTRRVLYDDGRCRRIIYETDGEKDMSRYVLERQDGLDLQRTAFPTLRGAVFALVGCIDRDE